MTTAIVDQQQLITQSAAARIVGVSPNTFRAWDAAGSVGPSARRVGPRRLLYRLSEINAWIQAGCPTREAWATRTEAGTNQAAQ